MNGYYTLLIALSLASSAFAQIPNAGFEEWSTAGSFLEPEDWTTLNSIVQGGQPLAERVPGAQGAYALKMTTRAVFGTPTASGVTSGLFDGTGFPWTERSAALEGLLRFNPAAEGEACAIAVSLSHWVPGVGRVYHGAGYLEWNEETAAWTGFSVPITYSDEFAPDSAKIILSSSTGAAVVAGTEFLLDALTFAEPATAVAEDRPGTNGSVRIHALGEGRYEVRIADRDELAQVTLFSAAGELLQRLPAKGRSRWLDLTGCASGVYIVLVDLADGARVVTRLVN